MHTTDIWHKFNLRGRKVIVLLILACCAFSVQAQKRSIKQNNPNYDKRFLSYGFLIGLHTSAYRVKYSDRFVTSTFDTVHSIVPSRSVGFSLGFIVNMSLNEFLDLRLLPKVAFYEFNLDYRFTDFSEQNQLVETTVVELPLLLKYKSVRRGNVRMYMVGGIKPGIEASGNNEIEGETESLPIRTANVSLDFGIGFDFYYPLFKFSPELRYSKGLANMLGSEQNKFSEGLRRITTNTVTLYLLFQ